MNDSPQKYTQSQNTWRSALTVLAHLRSSLENVDLRDAAHLCPSAFEWRHALKWQNVTSANHTRFTSTKDVWAVLNENGDPAEPHTLQRVETTIREVVETMLRTFFALPEQAHDARTDIFLVFDNLTTQTRKTIGAYYCDPALWSSFEVQTLRATPDEILAEHDPHELRAKWKKAKRFKMLYEDEMKLLRLVTSFPERAAYLELVDATEPVRKDHERYARAYVTIAEIGRRLNVSRPRASQLIHALERLDLVRIDKRGGYIELSFWLQMRDAERHVQAVQNAERLRAKVRKLRIAGN